MTVSSDDASRPAVTPTAVVEKELLVFLEARTRTQWHEDLDLFASGGLSSLFAMQLVVHLEKTYGISIRGADLRLDNFRTVRGMAALTGRLQRPASGDAGE
ncbi:acyl carrier protein [Streptomyces sp. DT24]|uniref:acyl carrier protein n=1 Tax=unclassified Streptomyces TaxID=2593676 RepID=UPI0023B95E2B|nr:acyl carrier protein [Streptomyces sp. AM 4-1-1]WEH32268.1 acyl carrier protein [Streptomyces sp. AM 4-1-1]